MVDRMFTLAVLPGRNPEPWAIEGASALLAARTALPAPKDWVGSEGAAKQLGNHVA